MKRTAWLWALPLVAGTLVGCRGTIPCVGVDENGKPIETTLPRRKYVATLNDNITDVQDTVIPTLDKRSTITGLHGIRVGLGLQGSVGLGDYFKLGGNIGFRMLFANQ